MSYTSGTTVRIEVLFKDFNEDLVDPSLIEFRVYDARHKLMSTTVITETNKLGVGYYFYDFVSTEGTFFYEWYGLIDDVPSLARTEISFSFS